MGLDWVLKHWSDLNCMVVRNGCSEEGKENLVTLHHRILLELES